MGSHGCQMLPPIHSLQFTVVDLRCFSWGVLVRRFQRQYEVAQSDDQFYQDLKSVPLVSFSMQLPKRSTTPWSSWVRDQVWKTTEGMLMLYVRFPFYNPFNNRSCFQNPPKPKNTAWPSSKQEGLEGIDLLAQASLLAISNDGGLDLPPKVIFYWVMCGGMLCAIHPILRAILSHFIWVILMYNYLSHGFCRKAKGYLFEKLS